MTTTQTVLNEVAAAFAAFDVSDRNARIAGIEEERKRIGDAVDTAEARCTQITRELYDSRPLNGRAVADALLANVEPMAAATVGPNRERLEEERASLRAGIGDLQDRLRELFDEIKAIQGEAFQPIAEHAQRLADAYLADARRAAEQIVEAYAAANAILRATRFGMDEEGRLKTAFAGVTADGALLPWRRALPVPAELVDVLAKLQGKGSALPVSVASSVAAP